VHPNRSATPDEKPPLFSRAARLITLALTASAVTLAAIVVAQDDTRPPIGCASGTLTLTGSTAFAPVLREVAAKYERDCGGDPVIDVDAHGSTAGIRELTAAGARAKRDSRDPPPVVALSDGPKPAGLPDLRENRVAVSVFALVVNDDVKLTNLSTDDVRRLYRGEIRNGRQVGGPDLPVRLVSRDANSGARSPTPPSTASTRTPRRQPSRAANSTRPNRSWPRSPAFPAQSATANSTWPPAPRACTPCAWTVIPPRPTPSSTAPATTPTARSSTPTPTAAPRPAPWRRASSRTRPAATARTSSAPTALCRAGPRKGSPCARATAGAEAPQRGSGGRCRGMFGRARTG
jgi:hypothetical protein